jgi:hypothetical protein
MWLLGGWNPNDKIHFPKICNSEVWSSHNGHDWNLELQQAPWEGRHYAGCVVHRGEMWIVGGDCNQGHYQHDVWSTPDGVNWKCHCETVPWATRGFGYTVVFKDKIWMMGGQTMPQFAPAPEVFYNDVWCSEDGVNWKRVLEHAPWSPRGFISGSAVFQNRLWLMGGGTYDTPEKPERDFFNEVWSTPDGKDWQLHAAAPWAQRQMNEVAVFDDRLWVLGGWGGHANRSDVWHSADGEHWEELPGTPWPPRHAASVFVFDDALWMVAGNNMTSDVWKLMRQ